MQPLIRTLTATALVLSCAALPGLAQDHDLEDAKWEVIYLDADGEEVRRNDRAETVARVEGPRDTFLEVGCNASSENRYLRVSRISDDRKAQFAGEELVVMAEVFSRGDVLHSEDLTMPWREADEDAEEKGVDGYYQARNRARLANAMREGFRVVLTNDEQGIRLPFTLRGSYVAIGAVPCD